MKLSDKIELTIDNIIDITLFSEIHGGDIIASYLLGDRDNERVEIYDKETKQWKDCFIYPWEVDAYEYKKFRIRS